MSHPSCKPTQLGPHKVRISIECGTFGLSLESIISFLSSQEEGIYILGHYVKENQVSNRLNFLFGSVEAPL